jgi:ABC-type transport system substrate-binding protein
MNVKKGYTAGAWLVLLCIGLSSCYSKKKNEANIFHYNEFNGIASLDPAFAKSQSTMWPAHQLFNTLVEIDDSLRIIPSIATHWDISGDRSIFTFHLRNDVYFHDDDAFPGGKGRKLTAADVVYSFSRILDKKLASPGAWIFNRKVDTLQPFVALDDSTFQLKLLRPYNPILGREIWHRFPPSSGWDGTISFYSLGRGPGIGNEAPSKVFRKRQQW